MEVEEEVVRVKSSRSRSIMVTIGVVKGGLCARKVRRKKGVGISLAMTKGAAVCFILDDVGQQKKGVKGRGRVAYLVRSG